MNDFDQFFYLHRRLLSKLHRKGAVDYDKFCSTLNEMNFSSFKDLIEHGFVKIDNNKANITVKGEQLRCYLKDKAIQIYTPMVISVVALFLSILALLQ